MTTTRDSSASWETPAVLASFLSYDKEAESTTAAAMCKVASH